MDESSWLRTAATWLAGLSIMLVVVNAGLMVRNQDAQREVAQRQSVLNQAAQVSRVNQFIVQTAYRTAIERKDDALMALLERHGVKVNAAPSAPGAPEEAPSPAPDGKTP